MDKSKLMTIGTLSKLTGVHIKSLRYYDAIGILPPAYVDPRTGYRYYSFPQIHIVEAIQLCIDLDIPLKHFPEFVGSDSRHIHYAKLLSKGSELAEEKIRSIQDKLGFIREIRDELAINRSLLSSGGGKVFAMPEKVCLTLPYDGALNTPDYYKALNRLFGRMKLEDIKPRVDFGLLLLRKGGEDKQYIFYEIDSSYSARDDMEGLVILPPAGYRFLQAPENDMSAASRLFPDIFASGSDTAVIIMEPFLEISDTSDSLFEFRCMLP